MSTIKSIIDHNGPHPAEMVNAVRSLVASRVRISDGTAQVDNRWLVNVARLAGIDLPIGTPQDEVQHPVHYEYQEVNGPLTKSPRPLRAFDLTKICCEGGWETVSIDWDGDGNLRNALLRRPAKGDPRQIDAAEALLRTLTNEPVTIGGMPGEGKEDPRKNTGQCPFEGCGCIVDLTEAGMLTNHPCGGRGDNCPGSGQAPKAAAEVETAEPIDTVSTPLPEGRVRFGNCGTCGLCVRLSPGGQCTKHQHPFVAGECPGTGKPPREDAVHTALCPVCKQRYRMDGKGLIPTHPDPTKGGTFTHPLPGGTLSVYVHGPTCEGSGLRPLPLTRLDIPRNVIDTVSTKPTTVRTGQCTGCNGRYRLDEEGLIEQHDVPARREYPAVTYCNGSNGLPRTGIVEETPLDATPKA